MRTIATLNLPATTSGIWRSVAPAAVPVAAQVLAAAELPAAAEPLGVAAFEQAPKTTIAAVSSDNSRRRVVTMDSPPRRTLGRIRAGWHQRARQRDPEAAARFPGRNGRPKDRPGQTADVAPNRGWPGGARGAIAPIRYHRSDVRTDRRA